MPATIQDVFLQFDPMEALEADDPRYVDCFTERGVSTLYANMALPLAARRPTVQFLSGHLGDGKTTLLKHLQQRFEDDGYFVVYGEVDQWLDLADIAHEELLLALLVTIDEALRLRYREDCEAGVFQPVFERLSHIAQVARTHQLARLDPEVRERLLSKRLVFEYWLDKHGFWYDVCPLCEE